MRTKVDSFKFRKSKKRDYFWLILTCGNDITSLELHTHDARSLASELLKVADNVDEIQAQQGS